MFCWVFQFIFNLYYLFFILFVLYLYFLVYFTTAPAGVEDSSPTSSSFPEDHKQQTQTAQQQELETLSDQES